MFLLWSIIAAMVLIPSSTLTRAFKPLSVMSWNVNGIRSFLKHDANGNVLKSLLETRKVDVLCLQETKIQTSHQDGLLLELAEKLGVSRSYWSSSTARKGYSGTAVCIFDKSNFIGSEVVSFGIGDMDGDAEGRSITIETDQYTLVNSYVPNSGAELAKLNYRTSTWDTKMAAHINNLKVKRPSIPVIFTGDLNVAHTARDYYNPQEARTKKQAGTTPQEQESFGTTLLQGCSLVDTFRQQHPEKHTYSYFGSRLGDRGRREKLGMRLDYVLLSHPEGSDPLSFEAYIEDEISHPYSDHCPVGAIIHLPELSS